MCLPVLPTANPALFILPSWFILVACGGSGGGSREPPPDEADPSESSPASCRSDAPQDSAEHDPQAEPPPALRETGMRVGVALSAGRLSRTEYAETAAREFNYLTPENEMKWDTIEPSPAEFDFGPADTLMRFAEEHDMLVKGHVLIWQRQVPWWVESLSSEDQVREAMTRHIEGVVEHFRDEFPGRLIAWDVVNEALASEDGNISFRDSVFHRYLGEGYLAEAFEIAHRTDPDALLFYNDYGIEGLGNKSTATFELVSGLVEDGVPIHGVGFQMHTRVGDRGPSAEDFSENLARYAELGLPVNISELDVSVCDASGSLESRISAQQTRYNQLAGACLQIGQCLSITVWGLADGDSWLNTEAPCEDSGIQPSPLVFDDDYNRKPAWWGLLDALLGCYY
jgi:endo-1,4-beta-xylanase